MPMKTNKLYTMGKSIESRFAFVVGHQTVVVEVVCRGLTWDKNAQQIRSITDATAGGTILAESEPWNNNVPSRCTSGLCRTAP